VYITGLFESIDHLQDRDQFDSIDFKRARVQTQEGESMCVCVCVRFELYVNFAICVC